MQDVRFRVKLEKLAGVAYAHARAQGGTYSRSESVTRAGICVSQYKLCGNIYLYTLVLLCACLVSGTT